IIQALSCFHEDVQKSSKKYATLLMAVCTAAGANNIPGKGSIQLQVSSRSIELLRQLVELSESFLKGPLVKAFAQLTGKE
ncbi:hypothetical protein HDU76_002344, partial [Blyttiomyces sp. JEL0837]